MNRMAERIKELEDRTEELEDEVASWEKKTCPSEEYERVLRAVKDFCCVCPLKDDVNCVLCDLHKWRDGEEGV